MLIAVPQKTQFWFVHARPPPGNIQLSTNAPYGDAPFEIIGAPPVASFKNHVSGLWPTGATAQVVKSSKTITGSAKNPDVGA